MMISAYDAYLLTGASMAVFVVVMTALVYLSDVMAAREKRKIHH